MRTIIDCITSRRCWLILSVMALIATMMALTPGTARAQTCAQDIYNLQNKQTLGCTANDVSIAQVTNVRDPATGNTLSSCVLGSTFNFIADFEVKTTSSSSRSNIGMYIATNSTTQALTGKCDDNIIPPPSSPQANGLPAHFPCAAGSSIACGTDYYDEFDPSPDSCGDSSSADNGGFGTGTQKVTLEIDNYLCVPPAGTNQLVLPNCTTWQVPGKTLQCTAPSGQQSFNNNAIPGSPSKCNCEVISLPVIAQTPSVVVQKECTTTDTAGPATNDPGNPSAIPPVPPTESPTACSSGIEGTEEVTYSVQVTNQSNFGNITITTLSDSVYGNIAGTCPGAGCTADSTGCTVPHTIAAGGNYSCTFTAHKTGDPPGATVTNKVDANGTSQYAGALGDNYSNTVTVTPVEAPASATVTKGVGSPELTAGCATATFTVDVHNSSATTYDETETLTALSDSVYGSIAPTVADTTHVSGDTCFTSASGVSIAPGGDYTCQFNGQFCGTLTSVEEFGTGVCSGTGGTCTAGKVGNSCNVNSDCDLYCQGLTHTNYINSTINGDEGASDTVTATHNTLHTSVCLSPYTQSQ